MNKWEIILQYVKKNYNSLESTVQKVWENLFADSSLFGYSSILGEVESHRSLKIGSKYIETDIVIRNYLDNKDLFIVELKQHNLKYREDYKQQLLSYMRIARINVGLLVCDRICLYYLKDDQEHSIEIPFSIDNHEGLELIDLLSKNNFTIDKIENFIKNDKIKKEHISKIKNNLTKENVKSILINYYLKEGYSKEEIDNAFNEIINNKDLIKPICKSNKVKEVPAKNHKKDQLFIRYSNKIKDIVFHINSKAYNATGMFVPEGFKVLKESELSCQKFDSLRLSISKIINEGLELGKIIKKDNKYITKEDFVFTSPSSAACFIYGRSSDGNVSWVDENGVKLEFYRDI